MQAPLPLVLALAALLLSSLSAAQRADTQQTAQADGATPRENVSAANADRAWRPSPEQRAAVEATTKAYFAARDANKPDEAYAFLSAGQKRYQSPGEFEKSLAKFNADAGPMKARRLRAITWYKDTPQGAGLYVAVDYASDFENLALHCGYVVWHEQPDGGFLQVREETNMIDKTTMNKLTPAQLAQVRAQYRC